MSISRQTFTRALLAAILPVAAMSFSGPAAATEKPWPTAKEIRLVVPFPAGGGADTLARIIAPALAKELKQSVIVENIAGAGGSLATQQVATQGKPDGYTLLYVTNGTLGTNPALYPNVGYNALKDFDPVAQLTAINMVMVVNPTLHKETTLAAFLAKARSAKAPMTFASSGNGTTSHLGGVMFKNLTGIDFEHIPYRGGAAAMTDVLGARIDFMIDVAPNTLRHVDAQKLTALGVGSRAPLATHPTIPTIATTVRGFELFAWDGIVVKSGTDAKIVAKLNAAIEKSLKDPAIEAAYRARGAEVVLTSPAAFKRFIQTESIKWADLVKKANTKLD